MQARFCDEWDSGFGWIAAEPRFLERASHAVRAAGRVWLTDPVDAEGVEARIHELGQPGGVVQLLDRHGRDSAALARRLGVPLYVTPFAGVPGAPFAVLNVVRVPGWREAALWFAAERVLICGDALGSAPYYRAGGERVAVHPLLRLTPPTRFQALEPRHLLLGHGEGLHGEGVGVALRESLRTSRRRTARWAAGTAALALRRVRGG